MRYFDSYIFDMDGTLWDAVDSYCAVWNRTVADCGADVAPVTRKHLEALMGRHLDFIYSSLIGDSADKTMFMDRLEKNERAMMPTMGGRLYDGVRHTLASLAARGARLFMVSNCQADGLPTFISFNGFDGLFTDTLSFGATGKEKDANIKYLVERYNLKAPLYIGDTEGDCLHAHVAGVPFAWAAYGFGRDVTGYEYKIDKIEDLLSCTP